MCCESILMCELLAPGALHAVESGVRRTQEEAAMFQVLRSVAEKFPTAKSTCADSLSWIGAQQVAVGLSYGSSSPRRFPFRSYTGGNVAF